MATGRAAAGSLWVLPLLVVACGLPPTLGGFDSGPPPPSDGGPPVDGSPQLDGGPPPALRRPDGGPRLPGGGLQEIVLPFLGEEAEVELRVASEVGTLDVFFNVDTTGSFGGEIDELQSTLRSDILPALRNRVPNIAFGVGSFQDFPRAPFGEPSDRAFRLLSAITTREAQASSAVAALDQPLGSGGDVPEAGFEALFQIATGEGFGSFIEPFGGVAAPGGGTLGGAGFRPDAFRVIVHVTDAPSHTPREYAAGGIADTRGLDATVAALDDLGIRVLGIASGENARPDLEQLALRTGSFVDADDEGFCRTGVTGTARPPVGERCPLVFDINENGTGLDDAVVDALEGLLATVAYREVFGEAEDPFGFVQALEAGEADPPEGSPTPFREDRRPPGDDILDTFVDVTPGTELQIVARLRNVTIPPADYDQIFRIVIRVVGDGVTLASRELRVVVPFGRTDP